MASNLRSVIADLHDRFSTTDNSVLHATHIIPVATEFVKLALEESDDMKKLVALEHKLPKDVATMLNHILASPELRSWILVHVPVEYQSIIEDFIGRAEGAMSVITSGQEIQPVVIKGPLLPGFLVRLLVSQFMYLLTLPQVVANVKALGASLPADIKASATTVLANGDVRATVESLSHSLQHLVNAFAKALSESQKRIKN